MTTVVDAIKDALRNYNGKWTEKKGVWSFEALIAERKAFLSKKQLTYSARIRQDETLKSVKFSEMLTEAGSGFSSGGDFDGGISTGFGMKTETYKVGASRQGSIAEQSVLFAKEYSYQFDYSEVREKVRAVAEQTGYSFEYQILPVK